MTKTKRAIRNLGAATVPRAIKLVTPSKFGTNKNKSFFQQVLTLIRRLMPTELECTVRGSNTVQSDATIK